MLSRWAASAQRGYASRPSSSGPRWRWALAISRSAAISSAEQSSASNRKSPAIPHIDLNQHQARGEGDWRARAPTVHQDRRRLAMPVRARDPAEFLPEFQAVRRRQPQLAVLGRQTHLALDDLDRPGGVKKQ